jgi:hypothetical protein
MSSTRPAIKGYSTRREKNPSNPTLSSSSEDNNDDNDKEEDMNKENDDVNNDNIQSKVGQVNDADNRIAEV